MGVCNDSVADHVRGQAARQVLIEITVTVGLYHPGQSRKSDNGLRQIDPLHVRHTGK